MAHSYLFTSESVSEGHPDKVSDQISDSILDAILEQDPNARVAAETLCNTGLVLLAGEISTSAEIDYIRIARETLKDIGYDNSDFGIDYKGTSVLVAYDKQSGDIAQGVDKDISQDPMGQGAGDQGLMFGYACDETRNKMPIAIDTAHKLVLRQAHLRKENNVTWLRPDAKSQVTIKYEDGIPTGVDTVVLSTQHSPEVNQKTVKEYSIEEIIKPCLPELSINNIKYLVNPTGRFVVGGPQGDCGLTGRKIIVDTYGGAAPHGGGAFSGKDPSKVDRSAAYAARYVAKNIVAAGLSRRCLVQLSYAIGVAEPTSIHVTTMGTGIVSDSLIEDAVKKIFDLRPRGIIKMLDLLRPIYKKTSAYGHFGREVHGFTWEEVDKLDELKNCCL